MNFIDLADLSRGDFSINKNQSQSFPFEKISFPLEDNIQDPEESRKFGRLEPSVAQNFNECSNIIHPYLQEKERLYRKVLSQSQTNNYLKSFEDRQNSTFRKPSRPINLSWNPITNQVEEERGCFAENDFSFPFSASQNQPKSIWKAGF